MKNSLVTLAAATLVYMMLHSAGFAQSVEKNIKLHVNPKWKQCSFQLDHALTQEAWHEFTEEAGLVAYYRPLREATPMGTGKFEFAILQWETTIDDSKSAWNDTFVHPDSTHWLVESDRLAFPGFTFRMGISEKIDVGAYWTKHFGANYGLWGGQIQYSVVHDPSNTWAAAARITVVSLYGPDDLGLIVYGLDLLASKQFGVYANWVSVSPYAGVSTYVSNSHETATAVDLRDEHVLGIQGMAGAVAHISAVRLAAEYNVARLHSFSIKLGVDF